MNNDWWVLHIKQLVLPKFGIKRKFAPCGRTCHAADIGQMWPENDAHHQRNLSRSGHWPNVAKNDARHRRTLSHCGLLPDGVQNVPLVGGLCLTVDFYQMWSKMCPSLEDFVSLQTSTKCGSKCAPCWRTLSHCGLRPMWSGICPSLEDFVSLRTLTRCGPNMCPSLEDFVMLQTLTKCGPNMCPSTKDFVLLWSLTRYGSTMYSSSKMAGTKQSVSKHQSTRNWNRHLWLRCHMINTLEGIHTNEPRQKMMHLVSITRQMTNDADRTQPSLIQHRT